MKSRTKALQKLAEGLEEIVANHAEKLAKGEKVSPTSEYSEEYEIEAKLPEKEEEDMGEEKEEEGEGVKGKLEMSEMAAGGASITPLPEAGPEEGPSPAPEEDEMEKAKKEIAARLAKKPVAIRRG